MLLQERNKIGENIVASWLRANGYHSVYRIQGNNFLGADSNMRKILFQIKVSEYPNPLVGFSASEIISIKQIASSQYKEPWGAILQVDSFGNLRGSIVWYEFNRM